MRLLNEFNAWQECRRLCPDNEIRGAHGGAPHTPVQEETQPGTWAERESVKRRYRNYVLRSREKYRDAVSRLSHEEHLEPAVRT